MKPARLAWVPLGLAGLLLLSLCRSRSSPLSSIPTPTAPPAAPTGTWRLWEAPWPPGARPVDWRP